MPNTSSSSQKMFKSKEFIEDSSSSSPNTEKEQYNILSRPKRNIILNTNADNLVNEHIQFNDSDSDDEDFCLENSNKNSSCNSSASTYGSNSSVNSSSSEDENGNDQLKIDQNKPKEQKDSNEVVRVKRKYTKRKNNPNNENEIKKEVKKPKETNSSGKSPKMKTSSKKSKNKLKKILNAKKLEQDNENDKFLSTFKNVKTKVKTPSGTTKKANRTQNYIKEETQSISETNHGYSGPFARQIVHSGPNDKSKSYSTYIVVSNHLNDLNTTDLMSDPANAKIETLVPRERIEQIDDPNNVTDWVCSLCHFKPNHYDGLGPLYGPYKISIESDEALKEIWLHEGCAVWNSNIFINDNQVYGIQECLSHAIKLECNSCKKSGATLTCSKLGCNRNFHYPCAILNNCHLNNENLTVQCKLHSVNQNKK